MGYDFRSFLIWCVLASVLCFSGLTLAVDRITRGDLIRDGQSLISSDERFELGFFSPQNSSFRYVGISYRRASNDSVVWVANRDRPITGTGGVLTISSNGNLLVLDGNNVTVWSSNVTVVSNNSTAVLMDTGNLILSSNSGATLYQSFDQPTDTYLPEMRVRVDFPEERRIFTSWRSDSDPSPGNYSMGVDPRGTPQIVIWEGVNRRWRSGHWNGIVFIGVAGITTVFRSGFRLLPEGDGLNFAYFAPNRSVLLKFRLNWEGREMQELWSDEQREWNVLQESPTAECDRYNVCGRFGICEQMESSRCSCLEGFQPRDRNEWSRGNWSGGCIRRRELQCGRTNGEADGFIQVRNVKLPDFVGYVGREDEMACQRLCLQNCSCVAYAYVDGINCMMWDQELVDIQHFQVNGQTMHLRVARSELGGTNHLTRNLVIIFVTITVFLLCISSWLIWRRRQKCIDIFTRSEPPKVIPSGEFSMDFSGPDSYCSEMPQAPGSDLAMPSFSHVAAATDNFSYQNKLGDGGFGEVFKGTLPCGQQVAVKRLSVKSSQGLEEFKNEITVIAKLQHRNLVRLLGCCVEGDEKMLLYEYMPNKSLDTFLFDKEKKSQLDWSKRFNIIEGIARGLLYLHRDSRLRIIHRDLKVSNILLDEEMNPKISDFGMARIFGGNQNEENTMRVVGTYGYMAPEYAMEGLFSIKSDVYSFGVLLLEIVTGRRNISFRSTENTNIIGHAWDLFNQGRAIELADPSFLSTCPQEQVLRCIHVGILCVQDNAANRPDMAAVVLMLESDNTTLQMPKQPTSVTSLRHLHAEMMSDAQDVSSSNVTMTQIIGR